MGNDVLKIRVARGGAEIGEFYLSYVELSLKNGIFMPDDWGWFEGMLKWEPLGELAKNARTDQGKKKYSTQGQRQYLIFSGIQPWRGMTSGEASDMLNLLEDKYGISPGLWINQPITDAQIEFLMELGESFDSMWTKGEASIAITQRLKEINEAQ